MVEVEKAGEAAAGRRTDDARPRAQAATSCRRGGTARTQETEMDWNSAQVNWQQFRCEVHANWGRLTSGHLDVIAGRRARLANKIEEAYGVTGDEAERQIKRFEACNQHPRPVSLR
jgi:uncharacterized protein YjbJ (UPF0337 family)